MAERRGIGTRPALAVAVYPHLLAFQGEPLARNLDLWVGAEHRRHKPIWLSQNCRDLPKREWPNERLEIFLLFAGESLIICDAQMRVRVLKYLSPGYTFKVPTAEDVVNYIYNIGRASNHRGVTWAIGEIERIAQAQRYDASSLLDQLRRRQARQ